MPSQVWILGTGGTIAGSAASSSDHVGYRAGQVGIEALVGAVPALQGRALAFEQLAQLDSKDMDFATWARLARRVQALLDDEAVRGIVITHGTDTLEETAYLLHRVLRDAAKPVVLTAAMRPASALSADGPQNLLDAVTLAEHEGARGVLVAFGGAVYRGDRIRKLHSYRVDAFGNPDGGPLAWMESGALRLLAPWPVSQAWGVAGLPEQGSAWPRVELLWNAAGVDGKLVALLQGLAAQEGRRLGLVVAGTGNGTLAEPLEAALKAAQAQGVAVRRCSRCGAGPVIGGDLPSAGALSAPQARVELLLTLLRP
ncbi:L-asparaginase [Inhella inkyongensis]|uniref:L-asparaginase n=1 Tax=Inhella inkyongensis TaxID=392593 RepID=A0A840SAZ0_9BURK|nr:asparaginase [Inhella inkyongensis]MBB5205539.1 L-asparaginase [Inhella inkyongensis]